MNTSADLPLPRLAPAETKHSNRNLTRKAHVVVTMIRSRPSLRSSAMKSGLRRSFPVERGSGFVEDEEAQFDGDGADDGDALLLAAGEFGRAAVGVGRELEALEQASTVSRASASGRHAPLTSGSNTFSRA